MCGVFGIFLSDETKNSYQYILNGITVLQHRGQDSAGIYTCKNKRVYGYKNIGKVSEVFKKDKSSLLIGNYGIGHIRYSTTGNLSIEQAQPLYTNVPYGLSLVHNGNLTNTSYLFQILKKNNIHINTDSDSDILLNCFALSLTTFLKRNMKLKNAIFSAVKEIMTYCKGSYSVIIMINGIGLVAFRDPYGIRPLCFGKKTSDCITDYITNFSTDYVISSESVGISSIHFDLIRDIEPCECIFITKNQIYNKCFGKLN